MKLSFYQYELSPIGSFKPKVPRSGSLLKMDFEDGTIGYADCHPWTELGDDPVQEQLRKLQGGETTRVTERCLYFGRIDAMARANNKSVFENLQIPKSNWIITHPDMTSEEEIKKAVREKFTYFKLKVGNDLDKELLFLQKLAGWLSPIDFKLRLDFNLKLSESQFINFLKKLEPLHEKIDYIEDPFTFDPARWAAIQKKHTIRLACDFRSHLALDHPEAAAILVIKPAIQDEAIFLESLRGNQHLGITSCLDHPLGQVSAAYVAALCYEKAPQRVGVCGLTSHYLYEPNAFSKLLTVTDTRLNAPPGTGFGFDSLLKDLPWKGL